MGMYVVDCVHIYSWLLPESEHYVCIFTFLSVRHLLNFTACSIAIIRCERIL